MIALLSTLAYAGTSLTLEQAVSMAVERNPDVRSAHLSELVADIGVTRAELDRFGATVGVQADLGVGVTKPWDGPTARSRDEQWTATATGTVPLYAGGRIRANLDQAHDDAKIASIDHRLSQRDVARAAYTAYWNVRGLELQIAAAREGIEASKEALAIIQSKANSGLAAGIDVNRSTVDLLSQQEQVLQEEAALERARAQLVQLLASDDPELELTTDPPTSAADPAVSLPPDPLARRPELERQELALDRADAARRLAQSAALPNLSLVGTLSAGADAGCIGAGDLPCTSATTLAQPDAGDLAHPTLGLTVGLSLAWNPFDLLRTRQAVDQAELGIDQVTAANQSETDRLRADIRSAVADVTSLRQRYPIVDQQVALARDNQGIVQDLYAQGNSTILDLFNAQAAFRSAAIQRAALQVDLATAELDLRWLQGDDLLSGVAQ